ncbi:MAG: extracellular solute-binding protein [Alphaproteobacteria bacterium]|nr:extracellular solute-binding protein [Alphaproteobacteria bacterium]
MSDKASEVYEKTMRRAAYERSLTRRRMLQASAAAIGAAAAASFVPQEVSAASGKVVHFAPAGKRLDGTLRAVQPLFNKAFPNIELEVASLPVGEALTKINTYMNSKSDAFDVITQDHAQFPALDAIGALTDLWPWLEKDKAWYEDYKKDVDANYRSMWNVPKGPSKDEGGAGYVAAITPDGNAMMTFYRKDIFDKKGLKVPETWDTVIDTVKEIHDPDNGVYGYAAAMKRDFWSGYQFYGILRSWGGDHFIDWPNGDFTVALNGDEAFKSLSMLVELAKYQHPVSSNASEDEINASFANGSALYSPLTWGTAVLNDPTYTDLHEAWHMDLSPRGTSEKSAHRALAGGFGQFIPTWAKNKDAAFDWMKFLNSPAEDVISAIVTAGGQPSRSSALNAWRDRKPFFEGLLKAFPVAVVNAPVIPEAYAIMGATGEEVADACNGQKSIEDAMAAMQKRVTRIMEDSGYYN